MQSISRSRLLSLDLDEMRTIQRFYRDAGREATDVELKRWPERGPSTMC
ncbi:MAG: hypothetical protein R2838_25040 [Caldilineaceae bacterium]